MDDESLPAEVATSQALHQVASVLEDMEHRYRAESSEEYDEQQASENENVDNGEEADNQCCCGRKHSASWGADALDLAKSLAQSGHKVEAVKQFEEIARVCFETAPTAMAHLGVVFKHARQWQDAEEALLRCLAFGGTAGPLAMQALNTLRVVYTKMKGQANSAAITGYIQHHTRLGNEAASHRAALETHEEAAEGPRMESPPPVPPAEVDSWVRGILRLLHQHDVIPLCSHPNDEPLHLTQLHKALSHTRRAPCQTLSLNLSLSLRLSPSRSANPAPSHPGSGPSSCGWGATAAGRASTGCSCTKQSEPTLADRAHLQGPLRASGGLMVAPRASPQQAPREGRRAWGGMRRTA